MNHGCSGLPQQGAEEDAGDPVHAAQPLIIDRASSEDHQHVLSDQVKQYVTELLSQVTALLLTPSRQTRRAGRIRLPLHNGKTEVGDEVGWGARDGGGEVG